MPVFEFQHEESGKIISVWVPVTAANSERHTQVQDGKTYKRVYAAPLFAKDTKTHDGTRQDFDRVVQDKKMKVGDAWKISAEMSEQRAARNGGKDPVKEQFYRDYEKNNKQKHPDVQKREMAETMGRRLRELGVRVE